MFKVYKIDTLWRIRPRYGSMLAPYPIGFPAPNAGAEWEGEGYRSGPVRGGFA